MQMVNQLNLVWYDMPNDANFKRLVYRLNCNKFFVRSISVHDFDLDDICESVKEL